MAVSLYRYFFFIAIYCVPRSLKNLECSLIDLLSAFLLKKLRAAGNVFCGERCLSRGKEEWGKEGKKEEGKRRYSIDGSQFQPATRL
jgi:hypothetical protein